MLKSLLLLALGIGMVVSQKPLSVDYFGRRSHVADGEPKGSRRIMGVVCIFVGMVLVATAATDLAPGIV